jgi:hypothetical protein
MSATSVAPCHDREAVAHYAEIMAYMAGSGDQIEPSEVTAFLQECRDEDEILEQPRGTALGEFLKQIRVNAVCA